MKVSKYGLLLMKYCKRSLSEYGTLFSTTKSEILTSIEIASVLVRLAMNLVISKLLFLIRAATASEGTSTMSLPISYFTLSLASNVDAKIPSEVSLKYAANDSSICEGLAFIPVAGIISESTSSVSY